MDHIVELKYITCTMFGEIRQYAVETSLRSSRKKAWLGVYMQVRRLVSFPDHPKARHLAFGWSGNETMRRPCAAIT